MRKSTMTLCAMRMCISDYTSAHSNKSLLSAWVLPWADPEGRTGGPPLSEKSQKLGFLSNTGPDPLKNHKATNLAFNVWPLSACHRNAISMAFH